MSLLEKLKKNSTIKDSAILSKSKFFTEKDVRITTTTQILYGTGMEANRDFTWYRILNPKGSVDVEKGEVPQ